MPDDNVDDLKKDIIRLREALDSATTDITQMLSIRGFKIHSKEHEDDLLIPDDRHVDGFYDMMRKYSFRLFLRDAIKLQKSFTLKDITRYSTPSVTGDFIRYMEGIGLVIEADGTYKLLKKIKSFGETLEWFTSEVFKREFGTEAIWGIKFKGRKAGGDYDLIAKPEHRLLHMEIKSSPPKQIMQSEIEGFFRRNEDLLPDLSIFFVDTELRMKDKIVPMFQEEIKRRGIKASVKRLEMEIFFMQGGVYIMNSRHSVEGNVQKVLAHFFRGGSCGRR